MWSQGMLLINNVKEEEKANDEEHRGQASSAPLCRR